MLESLHVVNPDGQFSKHYYAGSQRIVSRVADQDASIFEISEPRPAMAGTGSGETPSFDEDELRQQQIGDLTQILEKADKGTPVFKEYDPGDEEETNTEEEPDESGRVALMSPLAPLYFYHPDHLGTSTFLTDAGGELYQFFLNLPFGETMAEQHSLTQDYETPYKFNGKELDSETGLYYYGARYYDPRTSIWLSTDPLMEKYPSVNPYVYCVQNPINFTDPTGMSVDPSDLLKSKAHAEAFILFAKSDEGKAFLSKYASKGQQLKYNGEVFFQAGEAGEYDKGGIDLHYGRGNYRTRSTTSPAVANGDRADIYVDIAIDGFGLPVTNYGFLDLKSDNSSKRIFNLAKAVTHESFQHVDSTADDFIDNGINDRSNLPKQFRTLGTSADHYFYSQQAVFSPGSAEAQNFSVDGFNFLKKAAQSLFLEVPDTQIKTIMWDFGGSLIDVNQKNGKLIYKDHD